MYAIEKKVPATILPADPGRRPAQMVAGTFFAFFASYSSSGKGLRSSSPAGVTR